MKELNLTFIKIILIQNFAGENDKIYKMVNFSKN